MDFPECVKNLSFQKRRIREKSGLISISSSDILIIVYETTFWLLAFWLAHLWQKSLPNLPDTEESLKLSWNPNSQPAPCLPLPNLPSASFLPLHPFPPFHPPFSTHPMWITYRFCFPTRFWYMLRKPSWQSNRHGNWIMRWMVDDGLRLPHRVTSPVWIRCGLRLVSCSYEILWLSDL